MNINDIMYVVTQDYNIEQETIKYISKNRFKLSNKLEYIQSLDKNDNILYRSYKDVAFKTIEEANKYAYKEKILKFNIDEYKNIKYPIKPLKPVIKSYPTLEEIDRYKEQLIKYEMDMSIYEQDSKIAQKNYQEFDNNFRLYLAVRDGIDVYSDAIQDLVYNLAYNEGHSNGYYEISSYYSTYADFVKTVINEYKNSIV